MTPEDAVLKLQEKPADRFITFVNSETNKVSAEYTYSFTSGYFYKQTYDKTETMNFTFDSSKNTLTNISDDTVYTKK